MRELESPVVEVPLGEAPSAGQRRLWPWRRRVPVLMQLSDVECGPACLAMILSYHGRPTRVSECRDRCGAGRDGASARALVQTVESFGLKAEAFTTEPEGLSVLPLPAIAHWQFKHFVVVERWTEKWVDVVNPAVGRQRLSSEEFSAGFTGVVLTFRREGPLEAASGRARFSWWTFLRAYFPQVRWLVLQVILASLVLQLAGLGLPLFSKVLIDHLLPARAAGLLPVLWGAAGLAVALTLVSTWLRASVLLHVQARADGHLMPTFFAHLLSLPYGFFERRSSGDLLMRLASNGRVRDVLTGQVLSFLLDGTLATGYLAVLLARAPAFALASVALGMVDAVFVLAAGRRVRELSQRDIASQSESQSFLLEALGGIATLKSSGAEDRALSYWTGLFFRQLDVSLQRNRLMAAFQTASAASRMAAPLVLLGLGASRVLDGTLTVGELLAFNAFGLAFLQPMAGLVQSSQELPLVGAHLERLADVLQSVPEQDASQVRDAPVLQGRIELQGVSFRYDAFSPWVLRNVSFTVEPGSTVALVGPTGCGKTTLIKLLLGLYRPNEGRILYDGVPLEGLRLSTLRRQFGVVLQDSVLFNASIRDNISFNDPGMPLEKVVAAARLAAIHEELEQMPMGYETRVAEGGSGLSGGQRQRIAVARALALEPRVLFLDEATSHLDVATEARVECAVRSLQCTRVVVAHRLSTVERADAILVLHQGEVVERGTHEQLLQRAALYASLYRRQAEGGSPPPSS